jgi:ABC-2 type transport system permease protein
MAGLALKPEARGQFAVIARLRWQAFFHSLRTTRGSLEFVSRIFIGLLFAMFGVGGALGLGVTAYYFTSQNKLEFLAFLLWPVFLFWQLFPVMATAFTETLDSTNLLRFPLTYSSYFCIRVAYGVLDPVTVVGCLWLLGITAGASIAQPALLPWIVFVLFIFAVFNILLTRMIFAWLERWLARRRSREIMGVVFLLFILSVQFIGPLTGRYGAKSKPEMQHLAMQISPVQRIFPPGLAAATISQMSHGQRLPAIFFAAALCLDTVVAGWILGLRLRAEYHGENLSEASPRAKTQVVARNLQKGWSFFGLPGPIAAMLEKELRYLLRSGPLLFIMVLPVIMLLVFRLGPAGAHGDRHFSHISDLAFPFGAAYVLLLLTNLSFNSLGGDGAGVQFFFSSPVKIRNVFLGKNLAYSAITGIQIAAIFVAVCFLYHPPALTIALATICGVLFALPVEFAAANVFSIYSPKKIEFGSFGRQRPPQTTVLASFGVHAVIFGSAALVVFFARYYAHLWVAIPIFLLLSACSGLVYFLLLKRLDGMALNRREDLITELSKSRTA